MSAATVTGLLLPLALAFIMLTLGLTLQPADFRAVLARPRALLLGLAGQMAMLPLLAWGVALGVGLEPVMAVGLLVLAACPGGVSSGLLTHLAAGNVALSITLTALSSMAAMLSLPLWLDLALRHFQGSALTVELPLGQMVRSVFALTTLPVLLGMLLRAWQPRRVQRLLPAAGRLATGLFLLIVLASFWSQRQVLLEQFGRVALAAVLLNAATLGGAWLLASRAGLARRDRIAVATECGLQNAALGIFVAVELLRQPAISVPAVVYALWMNVGAIAFVLWLRRREAVGAGMGQGA